LEQLINDQKDQIGKDTQLNSLIKQLKKQK
jgi:hypothetical protein